MANFDNAYALTMKNEGLYAFNPNDNGGETYGGVSRKYWPSWEGWKTIDQIKHDFGTSTSVINAKASANPVLSQQLKDFYKKNFWDVYSLDSVNDNSIASELFDSAVNLGTDVESKYLQRALNVTNRNGSLYRDLLVDGVIGKETIKTLNMHPNKPLVLKILNVLQGARYISICEADKTQEIFTNTWFSRVTI